MTTPNNALIEQLYLSCPVGVGIDERSPIEHVRDCPHCNQQYQTTVITDEIDRKLSGQ